MHPVLSDQLARLRRADLRRFAEHHRAVAAATSSGGRAGSAGATAALGRMSAHLWGAGIAQAGRAGSCPP